MNHTAAAFAVVAALASAPAFAAEPPRDPFQAYSEVVTDIVIGGERRCGESIVACVELDAVVLKGIVTGTPTPRALVETKDGRSVTLRVGDLVGKGRVKAISRRGVVVEHMFVNGFGQSVWTNVTLTLG
ncbi:MAG: pilus assembly protein PilP [Deltaproteobacteria bacterium]|nr:pilus assembly protein PilP [Deltaproteobacteria bacterium]